MNNDWRSADEEAKLNQEENKQGPALTASEVAKHFGEEAPKESEKPIPKTEEELKAWEKAQDESEDIYKVAARVKNEARHGVGANLTAQGEALCNTFVHVFVALYEFSNKIPDENLRNELKALIRKQENAPGGYIAAMMAGVHAAKRKRK